MKSMIFIAVVLTIFSLSFAMHFKPPGEQERRKAIGPTNSLNHVFQRALVPGDDFHPIPEPKRGDWLATHSEKGQTFEDFERSDKQIPDATRKKIYLQPIGAFPDGKSPSLELLREYANVFFSLEVSVLPALSITNTGITTRINRFTGKRQILGTDVLNFLKKRIPQDAFCILAITMEDLYPDPSWNFAFGLASLSDRVAVFSFARYDPALYGIHHEKDYEKILLKRSCKVLAHELTHVFGIHHCIYFHCLMNGSNHLDESDARPLHLCPVDLRKVQSVTGFDMLERYEALLAFYTKVGFHEEIEWIRSRIQKIRLP